MICPVFWPCPPTANKSKHALHVCIHMYTQIHVCLRSNIRIYMCIYIYIYTCIAPTSMTTTSTTTKTTTAAPAAPGTATSAEDRRCRYRLQSLEARMADLRQLVLQMIASRRSLKSGKSAIARRSTKISIAWKATSMTARMSSTIVTSASCRFVCVSGCRESVRAIKRYPDALQNAFLSIIRSPETDLQC